MVKVVAFFRRRPGMAVEDFQTYWRTRHPEVVTKLAGVQALRPIAYAAGSLPPGGARIRRYRRALVRRHRRHARPA